MLPYWLRRLLAILTVILLLSAAVSCAEHIEDPYPHSEKAKVAHATIPLDAEVEQKPAGDVDTRVDHHHHTKDTALGNRGLFQKLKQYWSGGEGESTKEQPHKPVNPEKLKELREEPIEDFRPLEDQQKGVLRGGYDKVKDYGSRKLQEVQDAAKFGQRKAGDLAEDLKPDQETIKTVGKQLKHKAEHLVDSTQRQTPTRETTSKPESKGIVHRIWHTLTHWLFWWAYELRDTHEERGRRPLEDSKYEQAKQTMGNVKDSARESKEKLSEKIDHAKDYISGTDTRGTFQKAKDYVTGADRRGTFEKAKDYVAGTGQEIKDAAYENKEILREKLDNAKDYVSGTDNRGTLEKAKDYITGGHHGVPKTRGLSEKVVDGAQVAKDKAELKYQQAKDLAASKAAELQDATIPRKGFVSQFFESIFPWWAPKKPLEATKDNIQNKVDENVDEAKDQAFRKARKLNKEGTI